MQYDTETVLAAVVASPIEPVVCPSPVTSPIYHDVSFCMKMCAFLLVVFLISAVVGMHYMPSSSPAPVSVNTTGK